jgi:hypothetical protein
VDHIHYVPEFAALVGSDGKPIGAVAALVLCAACYLSRFAETDDGWFCWPVRDQRQITFLGTHALENARCALAAAGYIRLDRRGVDGALYWRVEKGLPETLYPNEKGYSETREPMSAGREGLSPNARTEEASVIAKRENRISRNARTPARAGTTSGIKNLNTEDSNTEARAAPVPEKRQAVPDSQEAVQVFMLGLKEPGNIADAEEFFEYYGARGWVMGGNVRMKDWKLAAQKWVRTNRARGPTGNLFEARNSHAPANNGHVEPESFRTRIITREEALEEIFREGAAAAEVRARVQREKEEKDKNAINATAADGSIP